MEKIPSLTKNLLIVNVLVYFGMIVAERYGIDLNEYLALHFIFADDFNPAQFFTYMFMHANFSHIFFNMFALWMFGSVLERFWGPKRFLFFYIVCGLGAGITQEVVQLIEFYVTGLNNFDSIPIQGVKVPMGELLNNWSTVGASGAVYGILLGFGLYFPNERLFIFPIPVPIKAKYFVIIYALIELSLGFSASDNVAHFAHLGGMLFGFFVLLYWKHNRWRQ